MGRLWMTGRTQEDWGELRRAREDWEDWGGLGGLGWTGEDWEGLGRTEEEWEGLGEMGEDWEGLGGHGGLGSWGTGEDKRRQWVSCVIT